MDSFDPVGFYGFFIGIPVGLIVLASALTIASILTTRKFIQATQPISSGKIARLVALWAASCIIGIIALGACIFSWIIFAAPGGVMT